jgi:hypothetical protein
MLEIIGIETYTAEGLLGTKSTDRIKTQYKMFEFITIKHDIKLCNPILHTLSPQSFN